MKKALALMLALAFCAACFVLTTGAAAPADEFSFLPEEGSNATITPTGCTYKINDNGSVTITLTAATGSLAVVYNDGTILEEKNINMKEDGQYILTSWTTTGSAVLGDVLVKHNRKDKDNADLYKTGMASSATYFEVNEDNYTAVSYTHLALPDGNLSTRHLRPCRSAESHRTQAGRADRTK